jgi:hypothetical protein
MQMTPKSSRTKKVPRPEIKISDQNTVLTYRPGSFYDLHLVVRQINEIISHIAVKSEIFTIKRGVKLLAAKPEDNNSLLVLKFVVPKRINDMSLISQAIETVRAE